MIAAICCGLAALCYAEFASTVPVSGSAYTFSLRDARRAGRLDHRLGPDPRADARRLGGGAGLEPVLRDLPRRDRPRLARGLGPADDAGWGHFNLAAFLLVALLTTLIAIGIKESLRVNLVLVGVKLFVVLFVIVAGLFYITPGNYTPFIPPAADPVDASGLTQPLFQWIFGFQAQTYGVLGIVSAASVVFFAYIGFDVVATTAEEAKNPQKDLPRGILGSLVDLHGPLRGRRAGDHRDGQLRGDRPERRAGHGLPGRRQARVRHADLRRCGRRSDDRGDDADDRRRAGAVRDEPRRAAAARRSRT